MSMYRCRLCGNTGHLSDGLVGNFYETIVCFSCIDKMSDVERSSALDEMADIVEAARRAGNIDTNIVQG